MQTPGGTVGWLPEIFGLLPEELQRRVATWNPEFLLRNVYKTRKTNIRAIEDGARATHPDPIERRAWVLGKLRTESLPDKWKRELATLYEKLVADAVVDGEVIPFDSVLDWERINNHPSGHAAFGLDNTKTTMHDEFVKTFESRGWTRCFVDNTPIGRDGTWMLTQAFILPGRPRKDVKWVVGVGGVDVQAEIEGLGSHTWSNPWVRADTYKAAYDAYRARKGGEPWIGDHCCESVLDKFSEDRDTIVFLVVEFTNGSALSRRGTFRAVERMYDADMQSQPLPQE